MKPRFFKTRADLRAWFERHHETATELWVGYHKKASRKPSITWPESVDEALCFGWIDGVRQGIDEDSYANRFTPRKPKSTWSAINVKRARELIDLGLMRPKGQAAFEARQENRTGIYSYEQRPPDLPPQYERKLRANERAWEFWRSVAPSYRKAATWWVISAKREDTRERRLATVIESSAKGERVPPLAGPRSARQTAPRR
jgi:uncharacterized protein YdeI (YjbR/CyaY-like superfamily)